MDRVIDVMVFVQAGQLLLKNLELLPRRVSLPDQFLHFSDLTASWHSLVNTGLYPQIYGVQCMMAMIAWAQKFPQVAFGGQGILPADFHPKVGLVCLSLSMTSRFHRGYDSNVYCHINFCNVFCGFIILPSLTCIIEVLLFCPGRLK